MYDVFEYIAANNPAGAKAIINKHGYTFSNVETVEDLGDMLREVVSNEGAGAMRDVVSIHPDHELIAEDVLTYTMENKSGGGCGCGNCGKKSTGAIEKYVSDVQGQTTGLSLQQGNLFLIGAALILAVAIVSK